MRGVRRVAKDGKDGVDHKDLAADENVPTGVEDVVAADHKAHVAIVVGTAAPGRTVALVEMAVQVNADTEDAKVHKGVMVVSLYNFHRSSP